jgi:hypothetical protein
MRTIILCIGAAAVLAGCTTRGEIRADRRDVRIQSAQCQNAKAYKGKRAQRVQCAQARDARRELRQDLRNPD